MAKRIVSRSGSGNTRNNFLDYAHTPKAVAQKRLVLDEYDAPLALRNAARSMSVRQVIEVIADEKAAVDRRFMGMAEVELCVIIPPYS